MSSYQVHYFGYHILLSSDQKRGKMKYIWFIQLTCRYVSDLVFFLIASSTWLINFPVQLSLT